jgi:hypothetical protein
MNLTIVSVCELCSKEQEKMKKCSKCKAVTYCSVECQKAHWSIHKTACNLSMNKIKHVTAEFKRRLKTDPNFLSALLCKMEQGTIMFRCSNWKAGDDIMNYLSLIKKELVDAYNKMVDTVRIANDIIYFDADDQLVLIGVKNI